MACQKKLTQFGWFAAVILFHKVLNETSQLSLFTESDSVLIHQLSSKIKETCFNLQEISEEEGYEYLPSNAEIIDEDLENDLIVITPTSNGTENNEEFQLTGVVEDKVKVDAIRQDMTRLEHYRKIGKDLGDKSLDAMKFLMLMNGVQRM